MQIQHKNTRTLLALDDSGRADVATSARAKNRQSPRPRLGSLKDGTARRASEGQAMQRRSDLLGRSVDGRCVMNRGSEAGGDRPARSGTAAQRVLRGTETASLRAAAEQAPTSVGVAIPVGGYAASSRRRRAGGASSTSE